LGVREPIHTSNDPTQPAASVRGPDDTKRSASDWDLFLFALAAVITIASLVALNSVSSTITSMSATPCPTGAPLDLQASPNWASSDTVAEIATGWYLFVHADESSIAGPNDPVVCARAVRPVSSVITPSSPFSPIDTVKSWLVLDAALLVPAYAATAVLALVVLRGRRWPDSVPFAPLLDATRSAVRRRWVAPAVIMSLIVGVGADLAENAWLSRRLDHWWALLTGGRQLTAADVRLGTVHALGLIKWIGLAVPILLILVLIVGLLTAAVAVVVAAVRHLWPQLMAAVLLLVVVIGPDQSADALRRLTAPQWAFTVLVLVLFATSLALGASGVLAPGVPATSFDQRRWHALPVLIGSALLILASYFVPFGNPWHGLIVPGVLLGLVGMSSLLLDLTRPASASRKESSPPARDDHPSVRRLVASWTGALPFVAVGLATMRASAGDLAVLGAGDGGTRLLRVLGGLVLAASAVPFQRLLRHLIEVVRGSERVGLLLLGGLVVLHLPGLMFHSPGLTLTWAPRLGSIAILSLFLSGLALIPVVALRAASTLAAHRGLRPIVVPSALRSFGFQSPPILGLVLVWFVAARFVSYDGYHDVRTLESDGLSAWAPLSVSDVARSWSDRQDADGQRPALLVAASGGGIRAAYWTSLVLTCVIERDADESGPCGAASPRAEQRRSSIVVLSGISGGSLGLASYVTMVGTGWEDTPATPLEMEWVSDHLGDDFLAATLAAWLFNDGVNSLLRPSSGVDRAAVLERAWEQAWTGAGLTEPFLATQAAGNRPLVLLNSFNAENGCRVNTSALGTVTAGPPVAEFPGTVVFADPEACGASLPVPLRRAMWSTADALAQICRASDWRVSTAALTSARFPFVSPAGRMASCEMYRAVTNEGAATVGNDIEVVDGGYRETSGASPIVELWPTLSGELERALARDQRCISPIFLQIDNGYTGSRRLPSGRSVLSQFTAPLTAIRQAPAGAEDAARQQSYDLFGPDQFVWITTRAHPGSSAPLGWVLSEDAEADLLDQLQRNSSAIDHLRDLLDHPSESCGR